MTNETDPSPVETPAVNDDTTGVTGAGQPAAARTTALPSFARLLDEAPHARVLSNGRYTTLVTSGGGGFSNCDWYAVTRWTGDRVSDHEGVLVYLRDLDSGEVWSVGFTPMGNSGGTFYARTAPGSVTLGRRHEGIEAICEIVVSPDANAELRRLTLRARGAAPRRIEVTFYAEIVAGHRGADDAHPAFSKLFVETAFDASTGVVTARRRPRASTEPAIFAAAALAGPGDLELETDRARFLGRGRTLRAAAAFATTEPLSGSVGSVLDPVFALRRTVAIDAGGEASVLMVLGAGSSREEVSAAVSGLATRNDGAAWKEVLRSAAAAERSRRKRFDLDGDRAELVQELAGSMLYGHPALAAPPAERLHARYADLPLHELGLPGDARIVVLEGGHDDADRAASLAAETSYLVELGLRPAVVLLCRDGDCTGEACAWRGKAAAFRCPVAATSAASLGDAKTAALLAFAHRIAGDEVPALEDESAEAAPAKAAKPRLPKVDPTPPTREKLLFDNGYGGFSGDGREYVVRVGPAALSSPADGVVPPMPWCNIVSNDRAGFLATESGATMTWAFNSRQNKLSPWSNDPITDPHGEALYLRDHSNGRFWSPLPGPVPSGSWCEVRHGLGWTRWLQRAEAVEQEVVTFLAGEDPARIVRVRLANRGSRERSFSLYWYARLVLGVQPNDSSRFVVTSRDEATGTLLATNPMSEDHADKFAFASVLSAGGASASVSWTTDRKAFLGRGGTVQSPRAVAEGGPLAGDAAGTGVDPCFAFEVPITLAPRGETEVVLVFGQGVDREAALAIVARLRETASVEDCLEAARKGWRDLVSAIEVQTPSKGVDLLLNGWLLYQALSCRIDGRTAYYQSGGAYGFRDQLQDSSALVYARPDLSRAQILLHAAHQFVEGDVLHWWHPPAGRGTRTRFSDDLNWLPYLTATYVATTGDESVYDEKAGFVTARQLEPGEDETYLVPARAEEKASIYEHCCRALDRSLTSGPHGLPLMGTGDWNDGMNRVGREGRGESVWMAFFLATILDLFVPTVEKRADWERLRRYRQYRQSLGEAIENAAWDGAWYRRAYYDDGEVLGSAASDECRIDAIAQAWAVLSGAASPERARSAMQAVQEHLVDEQAGIIRLLWPPFDKTTHDPGYIKGYVPGIRENGGQYSHAAMWTIRALAKMGQRDEAMRLFEMVSPVMHARDREAASVYKVEPYVVAADIYGVAPHLGRGGWTWYTGSAAWMYRTGIESLLGLTIEDGRLLRIKPCIPDSWPGFRLKYRLPDHRTIYDIEVENPAGCSANVVSAMMGNQPIPVDRSGARIVLRRDGKLHKLKVTLGA